MAAFSTRVTDGLLNEIRAIVGDRLTLSQSVRDQHGTDESYHKPYPPDAVVYPRSTEEVSEIVKVCARHKAPVIPYGTGTSLEGHIAALEGGICLDLCEMNAVVAVHPEDMDATVQSGVTRKQLNTQLHNTGLFFPVDPGADASIGGMAATRASGTNAVRYGTMRECVLAMTVVLADGRIIQTSRRARKSAAGYDLTRLFVGSEGTLGVITEVTVRLFGIPEAISSAVVSFNDIKSAVDSVISIIQMGIPIARIEFLDDAGLDAVNRYSGLNFPVKPTLFLEFHGTDAGVKEQAEMVGEICAGNGSGEFLWATKTEERNKLWEARHVAAYAVTAMRPGGKPWATDVCVPISRLADCILETKQDVDASSLYAPVVGHVGDGNFHLVMVIDPGNPDEIAEATALNDRLMKRAIAMDGTCTGEHGVGHGKMDILDAEHGEAVNVMAAVKKALDPDNIMNPGKIVRF
ncbi:MAG: FAD-binding protein [Rhodospirillales bacterium]|nr:FAD-binding protein [Rhodospirillales bacterium]